jgi:L-serine dehydratase
MIGPSSSHTAGALRIAAVARMLAKGQIRGVRFTLYGSFARTYRGHGTDRALLAGILGFGPEDARLRDAFVWAEASGLRYAFHCDEETKDLHPNTVDIALDDDSGRTTVIRGKSIGGGAMVIGKINGVEVDFSGEYNTLVIEQQDEKGVLAHITKCLCDFNVNIAFAKLFRESKGQIAYTIIETDEAIPEEAVAKILSAANIWAATLLTLDPRAQNNDNL